MALVFAIAIIATYIALCVTSVAGLQRMSLIERRQRETAYDPAFRTRRHLRAPFTHFDNRGVHEIADLNVVKDACTNLQQMMAAAFSPAHLLFLHEPPADDLVDGGLNERR